MLTEDAEKATPTASKDGQTGVKSNVYGDIGEDDPAWSKIQL